jgi:hypothetical protein
MALLRPVYDRFTEGFGTADLMNARALLGELRWSAPSFRRDPVEGTLAR